LSREVERGVDLIAAAPGRLVDFIERGKVKLGEGQNKKKIIKINKK
jgi:superfamily II DNA/RNA helicase